MHGSAPLRAVLAYVERGRREERQPSQGAAVAAGSAGAPRPTASAHGFARAEDLARAEIAGDGAPIEVDTRNPLCPVGYMAVRPPQQTASVE